MAVRDVRRYPGSDVHAFDARPPPLVSDADGVIRFAGSRVPLETLVIAFDAGATAEEMASAQRGKSSDPKTTVALTFAQKLVETRGQVTDTDMRALRGAGYDDQDIVEIIAHVALNLFTNYINVALAVSVDFPGVKLVREAA